MMRYLPDAKSAPTAEGPAVGSKSAIYCLIVTEPLFGSQTN
jgi:hypothetical protein